MTRRAVAAEILGQLLAAQSALQFLSGSRQAGEFVAHALRITPGVRATAALLENEEILDGDWGSSSTAIGDCPNARGSYVWRTAAAEEQVLVLPVETLRQQFGCLFVLASDRSQVEPYVPFMANFATALGLELDNKHQLAELESAYERLHASQTDYQLLFGTMTSGFAVHEIITDDAGRPVDYRFLEVNVAFEALTGLRAAEVVGRRVLEVIPDLEQSWIDTYGEVALTGRQKRFESYSAALRKHYEVHAYCPSPGRFATVFNDVTGRKRREDELSRTAVEMEEAYEREHAVTERLQKALLPQLPAVPGLELDAVYESASEVALVGGDFYDVLALDDERVMLAVGDVCGNGVVAAEQMAMTRYTLRTLARQRLDVARLLTEANRCVMADNRSHEGRESRFVTVAIVFLDLSRRCLQYASAGHPRVLVLDGMGVRELKPASGLPLGILDAATYAAVEYPLAAGSLLVLYTDGLSEARSGGRFFADLLPETVATLAGRRLHGEAASLVDQARRFADRPLRDDTVVVLARLAAPR